MNFLYSYFCSGNDQPTLTAPGAPGIEDGTPVTLDCAKAMSTIETDTSYEWYYNSVIVADESSSTLNIGNQRAAAGTHTCKVVAENSGTSDESSSIDVKYYCEYSFHIMLIIRHRN